jgi:hypothetical protein
MFYAHALFRKPPQGLTPAITFSIALALGASGALGALSMNIMRSGTYSRRISTSFLLIAIFFQVISCLNGYIHRSPSAADWGVFAVQVLAPIFLILSPHRNEILVFTLRTAVVFAFCDLFVNVVTYTGVARLSEKSGDYSSYGIHYLGLPGNSLAEGLVAFLAITYISSRIPQSIGRWEFLARILLLGLLFFSEFLIKARSDLGISIVSAALLAFRNSNRFSMALVASIVSVIFLAATFFHNPYNTDDTIRANLMQRGFTASEHNIFIGQGARYRATSDLVGNFRTLNAAGITESGTLDYAIAYGALSTISLYLSFFFALSAKRYHQTIAAVMLACLTGALAINGGLSSFLGSIALYISLIICQRDEWWSFGPESSSL